jgi:hypothetical protein
LIERHLDVVVVAQLLLEAQRCVEPRESAAEDQTRAAWSFDLRSAHVLSPSRWRGSDARGSAKAHARRKR